MFVVVVSDIVVYEVWLSLKLWGIVMYEVFFSGWGMLIGESFDLEGLVVKC